ncbi:LytTR family DNA-binding domain-containing protein [Chakrabartyella piscis]|uniref:LytR/AlgR family response regulator transcription factor n=1 Tax=Chakrabartyella piscis TaxID=2918914 RepID=UPI002958D3E4|nr:LytTR family DNA-binding domain-containing protein [Chakrabartyella piscis]
MQIAICDDLSADRRFLIKSVKEYGKRKGVLCTTVAYASGEELLVAMSENLVFDLIFLDICMDGKNGIEVAKEIRKRNKSIPIIFLTLSDEFALDAFSVHAFNYLLKPLEVEKFNEVMEEFCEYKMQQSEKLFVIATENGNERIDLNDLMYCESQGNYQYLHMKSGAVCKVRTTMKFIKEQLASESAFVPCGKAYIVGLQHVKMMNRKYIILTNDVEIPIPRGAYSSLQQKYFGFY